MDPRHTEPRPIVLPGHYGWVGRIATAGVHIGAILLQITAVLLVVNALYRYTIGGGFPIITEITRFALLYIVFLALAGTHLIGGHVRVELALMNLPARLRSLIEGYLVPLGSIFYLSLLGWAGWVTARNMFFLGTTTPSRPAILLWPVVGVIPLGCGLLIVLLLLQLYRRVRTGTS